MKNKIKIIINLSRNIIYITRLIIKIIKLNNFIYININIKIIN